MFQLHYIPLSLSLSLTLVRIFLFIYLLHIIPFDLQREHIFYSNDLKLLKQKDMLYATIIFHRHRFDSIEENDFFFSEKRHIETERSEQDTNEHMQIKNDSTIFSSHFTCGNGKCRCVIGVSFHLHSIRIDQKHHLNIF